jgi:hypothetical protein
VGDDESPGRGRNTGGGFMNCFNCRKEINRGNTRRVLVGKRKQAVCRECASKLSGESVEANVKVEKPSVEANQILVPDALPYLSKIPPIMNDSPYAEKVERIFSDFGVTFPARLIITSDEIAKINRAMQNPEYGPFGLKYTIVDSSLPDREPESFRGKYEILIREM